MKVSGKGGKEFTDVVKWSQDDLAATEASPEERVRRSLVRTSNPVLVSAFVQVVVTHRLPRSRSLRRNG